MAKKILVVDDDRDILESLQLLLELKGYIVEILDQANATYQKVQEFKPDLILLDVLMSGTDGRTICKTLKSDIPTRDIPIIMISAHPSAHSSLRDYGANAFLVKPFESDELLQSIKKHLN